MTIENNQEHDAGSAAESQDMHRLRDLLFGEQAQQTDDRFGALEAAVNSLRRENRNLRQAIEIEAMSRLEADREQTSNVTGHLDTSMISLSQILVEHLSAEKAKRNAQQKALSATLDAYQKSQDTLTGQLIQHLEKEQTKRNEQFARLHETLADNVVSQNDSADALAKLLTSFAKEHEARQNETVAAD